MNENTQLLDASGRPIAPRPPKNTGPTPCPACGAPPKRRVLSGGFGHPHDVCGNCGHGFEERTIW